MSKYSETGVNVHSEKNIRIKKGFCFGVFFTGAKVTFKVVQMPFAPLFTN